MNIDDGNAGVGFVQMPSFFEGLRRVRSLWLAGMMMLSGLGIWAFRSPPAEVSADSTVANAATNLKAGFMASDDDSKPKAASDRKAITPESPALFRFGAGYVGGFFIGLAFRKFLRYSIIAAGLVLAGLTLFKFTGLVDWDWPGIEAHIYESLAWTNGQAGAFKSFAAGYLPSTAATAAGLFMGFRHR